MIPCVALALQGGGTHGAFTWGVLDRLLDEVHDGRLTISALGGSSAGAVNATLCAAGLGRGANQADGAHHAQEALTGFWNALADRAYLAGNALLGNAGHGFLSDWNLDWSPVAIGMEIASLVFSPYDAPFYSNPLLPLLSDFLPPSALDAINGKGALPLYVCATKVSTNQRRIFTQPDISIATLLASACLPSNFRAIDIDGETYWDGGYLGNPALAPLIRHGGDLVVVSIDPQRSAGPPPRTARDILDRLNDINLNAPLVLELNAIHAINKLLERLSAEQTEVAGFRKIHVHVIQNDKLMQSLGFVSKANASAAFLRYLHESGHATADRWLTHNYAKLGERSSCDWKTDFDLEHDMIDATLKCGTQGRGFSEQAGTHRMH